MKILVTGVAGFIGSFLAEKLLKDGHEVIGIDNMFRGKLENINHLLDDADFKFYQIDIRQNLSSELFKGVEAVFHNAAINGTLHFYERPLEVLQVNVEGTINILEQAIRHGIRKIVFASSSEVYGDPLYFPTDEKHPIILPDVNSPRHSYAASKAIGEYYVRWFCEKNNIKHLILRIFNTYGPKMDNSSYGQVIPEFIRKLFTESEFTIIGPGTQTRSFCYIDDNIEMTVRCFNRIDNEVLNIGNCEEISIIKLAELLHQIVGKEFKYKLLTPRPHDPLRRVPNIKKVAKLTGFTPQISLEVGLRKTIDFWRKKYGETLHSNSDL
jgi:nucleoside-diphosphate-sugar epimerase